jgi:translation elongation factor EF-G
LKLKLKKKLKKQVDDNKLVATCYEQPVLVLLEQLVASLLPSSTLEQGDNNLFQTCHNNWEQAVRTHPDIGLTTTLLQLVCRSVTTHAKSHIL